MTMYKDDEKPAEYEHSFVIFSGSIEKWMIRLLITLFSFLLLFQLLLQFPDLRYYLVKVEQLEGVPFNR